MHTPRGELFALRERSIKIAKKRNLITSLSPTNSARQAFQQRRYQIPSALER